MQKFFKPFLDYPRVSLIIIIFITLLAVIPIRQNFRMETNLNEYMPSNHPTFIYSDLAEDKFNIKEGILIAIEHPDSIFNPQSLTKIIEIEKAVRTIPELEDVRIQSIYTGDNIISSDFGLEVKPFYENAPSSQEEATAIRDLVRNNPMVKGRMISNDERSALVVIELPESGFSQNLYDEIVSITHEFEYPENIYIAGRPIVEGTLAKLGPKDMSVLGPLVILVISIVLYLVFKSFLRTFTTLSIVLISLIWTFGLMTLLGIPLYSVSIIIPVMLVAIGVAYALHVYGSIDNYILKNLHATNTEIAEYSLTTVGKPALFAALTTVVGFISLITSQVYPVKYFGAFTAFGVALAWVLTMILVPITTILFGPRIKTKKNDELTTEYSDSNTYGAKFTDAIQNKSTLIYITTIIVLGASLFGISKVWINASFLNNFDKNNPIVKTDAFVNTYFGGTSTLNVILDSEEEDTFKNPEVLKLVKNLQEELATNKSVGDSLTLTTYIEQLNYVMHEEDSSFRNIPDSQELIAQYILLYEMSGDSENLWRVVDQDFQSLNLTIQMRGDDTKTIESVLKIVNEFENQFEQLDIKMNFAGSGYKSLVFSDLILKGQLSSLGLSVLIVLVLLTFYFKSFLLGLISTIPILLSMAVNFGIMGLLNLPLTISTALISSIAIGIGVDYAIHFITHYKNVYSNTKNEIQAAHFAMTLTGKTVFLNAIIVISGFLVMFLSAFPPNRQIGALISLNMFVSFISTITLMFLILRRLSLWLTKKNKI